MYFFDLFLDWFCWWMSCFEVNICGVFFLWFLCWILLSKYVLYCFICIKVCGFMKEWRLVGFNFEDCFLFVLCIFFVVKLCYWFLLCGIFWYNFFIFCGLIVILLGCLGYEFCGSNVIVSNEKRRRCFLDVGSIGGECVVWWLLFREFVWMLCWIKGF